MRDPLNIGSAVNSDSHNQTPLLPKTPSTSEHVFPAPSSKRAGKDANEHSHFGEESKQVPSLYNLARRLPVGELSQKVVNSLVKSKSSSTATYELRIEGALVAVSQSLKGFHRFIPQASPFKSKEVGEFHEFRAPSGEWVEIKKINNNQGKI